MLYVGSSMVVCVVMLGNVFFVLIGRLGGLCSRSIRKFVIVDMKENVI